MKVLYTLIAAAALTVSAYGSTITFTTATGATTSGGPVNASTTITTADNGLVTLSLTNNQTGIVDIAQAISDLFFTLSSAPTTALNTTTTPTGTLVTIGTDTTPDPTFNPWTLTSSGAVVHLDSLNSFGPDQTIIGPGPYTSANGSISGNDPHNPFIQQTATFSFTVAGVTSATTITAATFSFGTTSGINVPGGPSGSPTPEPGTFLITSIGIVLSAVGLKRRYAVKP